MNKFIKFAETFNFKSMEKLTDRMRNMKVGDSFLYDKLKYTTLTQTRQRIQKETGFKFSIKNKGSEVIVKREK